MTLPMPSATEAPNARSTDTKRVFIVDDHVSIVEMIGQFIADIDGFESAGGARSVDEALEACTANPPDIIILDLILAQGAAGLRLLDELKPHAPHTLFLIYSGNLTVHAVRHALAGGVLGIVDKGSPLSELRTAVQTVAEGKPYYSGIAGEFVRQLVKFRRSDKPSSDLSPRERSVLSMIAEGLSSKEIAKRLGLSMHTVVNHRSNVMRKTGLHRVAQLSRYAVEIGLIKPPQQ